MANVRISKYLSSLTNEELIREVLNHSDIPLVNLLAKRLSEALQELLTEEEAEEIENKLSDALETVNVLEQEIENLRTLV